MEVQEFGAWGLHSAWAPADEGLQPVLEDAPLLEASEVYGQGRELPIQHVPPLEVGCQEVAASVGWGAAPQGGGDLGGSHRQGEQGVFGGGPCPREIAHEGCDLHSEAYGLDVALVGEGPSYEAWLVLAYEGLESDSF